VVTSTTDPPVAIKPSRAWYAVAAALFVGGLIPAVFLVRSAVQAVDFGMSSISGGTIEVQDKRLSIFAPEDVPAPRLITCTVTGPTGQQIPLDVSGTELNLDGQERVGRTPEDLAAGTYQLNCADRSGPLDADAFDVLSTEGWTDAILKIVGAVILVGVCGLVAITIVIVTAVLRSNARRRAIQPQPPYVPPPPPGYPPPPPPGYPPPAGHPPPPGYPPAP
jgi:hypothetical protein